MNKDWSLLVLSPQLSQSLAWVRVLRRADCGIKVIGGVLPGERIVKSLGLYDEYIYLNGKEDISIYDVILPAGSKSMQFLFSDKETHSLGDVLFLKDAIRVFDKKYLLEVAEKNCVPVPRTWETYLDAEREYEGPIFFKPLREGTPGIRDWAKTPSRVPSHVKNQNYIFQEMINGAGVYGVGFVADSGEMVIADCHFESISYPRAGGSAAVVERFESPRLRELTERLTQATEYTGWGLAEFKWCPQRHDFVLMEINAKFWASVELVLRNNPEWVKRFFGLEVDAFPTRGLIWPDRVLGGGLRSIWGAIRDFGEFPFVLDPPVVKRHLRALMPRGAIKLVRAVRRQLADG